MTLTWYSPLAVEECLRRLREACDEERLKLLGYAGHAGSKPVIARIEGSRFTLFRRHERQWVRWYRRAELPLVLLSGRCEALAAGASFRGGTSTSRSSLAVVLGSLVVLLAGAAAVLSQVVDVLWLPLLYPTVAALSVGTYWYWYVARVRRDRAYLTRFLRELLSARDAAR